MGRVRKGYKRGDAAGAAGEHCSVPGCERARFSLGLCQTHHRQLTTKGYIQPIRAYRKRAPGTIKFSGLRLSPACAGILDARAAARGISQGAAVAEVLEAWSLAVTAAGSVPRTEGGPDGGATE